MRIKHIKRQSGFTLIELLITLFLTGVLAAASLSFYTTVNQQALTQAEIADMQQLNRLCLEELGTALRSSGYGLSGQAPYQISGSSLAVFTNSSGSVDTTRYYLQELSDSAYASMNMIAPDRTTLYNLMKQRNSDSPEPFSGQITLVRYTVINPKLVAITVETQTTKADDDHEADGGYRKFINTERVVVRNAS